MNKKKILMNALVLAVSAILFIVSAGRFVDEVNASALQLSEFDDKPEILVGLTKCSSAVITFSAEYSLSTPDSGDLSILASDRVSFDIKGGRISLTVTENAGVQTVINTQGPVFVASEEAGAFFTVQSCSNTSPAIGSDFRGNVVLIEDGGSLLLANLIGIEEYLWSVVSCETYGSWPIEALKSQAVASRTYALYKIFAPEGELPISNRSMYRGRTLSSSDVRIWATDQIYKGKSSETQGAIEACTLTDGIVLTYMGELAAAFFHADAAGMTESSRFVWGGAIPYLTGVQEVPNISPHTEWVVSLTEDEVAAKLAQTGFTGHLNMIEGLVPGVSGRWSNMLLHSGTGNLTVQGNQFRLLTGLKSLWFSVFRQGLNDETLGCLNPGLTVAVDNGNGTQQLLLRDCVVLGHRLGGLASEGAFAVSVPNAGPLTFWFKGRGWGHGVGLSQWGAKAMADQGESFSEILMHYYPGTIQELWW